MSDANLRDGRLVMGTGSLNAQARMRENFPRAMASQYSFTTTPIRLTMQERPDDLLGRATGFFWRHQGRVWLVSNCHVFAGRNPLTLRPFERGLIPSYLRLYGYSPGRSEPQFGEDGREIINASRPSMYFGLPPQWVERLETPIEIDGHPVDIFGVPIDGAGIPGLGGFGHERFASVAVINDYEEEPLSTKPGDDLFVLGYPFDNLGGMMARIWKRGTMAADVTER